MFTRKETLLSLFVKNKGVLSMKMEHRSCDSYCRSMVTGKQGRDEWTEEVLFIEDERLTSDEVAWLNSQIELVPVPEGYYRCPDGVNTIKEIPKIPESSNMLELYGEIGRSVRRVAPLGTIWKGLLQDFRINEIQVRDHSVYSVTLDGVEILKWMKWHQSKAYLEKVALTWGTLEQRVLRLFFPTLSWLDLKTQTKFIRDGNPYKCKIIAEVITVIGVISQKN